MTVPRRALSIGPRTGLLWPATLIEYWPAMQVHTLAPVGSWHDVIDHQVTFEVDEILIHPSTAAEMTAAGVGPPG